MTEESRPNVFLLVIDACRADYLTYVAPSPTSEIGSFAEEATVFRRAISSAPWTLPSVTSLLTGRDPHEHGATSRSFELKRGRTLTADLKDAGYRTVHLSPKTWIGDWLPQGRGFDRVEEFTGPAHRYFEEGADVRNLSEGESRGVEWYMTATKRALATNTPLRSLGNIVMFQLQERTGDAWLDNVRASERAARIADEQLEALADREEPFFIYAHLMDPHLPFYVPKEFRTDRVRPPGCSDYEDELDYIEKLMDDIWNIRTGDRELGDREIEYLRMRYRDELACVDSVFGRIQDSLQEHGLAEETLVALTGDHGEHLGERVGDRTLVDHQTSIRLPVLRVPLIVRYPGVFDDRTVDDLVQPHYLAASVRALAGLDHDATRSLLPADSDTRRETTLAEYAGVVDSHPPEDSDDPQLFAPRRCAITGRWKLDEVAGDRRAYRIDWVANETERIDVTALPNERRAELADLLDTTDENDDADRCTIPTAVEENLSELGYL